MKALIILAIVISSLSLISAVGAIVAIATMPDLRQHVDHFWMSTALQFFTAVFVIAGLAIWFKRELHGQKYLIPIWIIIVANICDIAHAILAYSDWPYALGATLFRIFPLFVLAIAGSRSGRETCIGTSG